MAAAVQNCSKVLGTISSLVQDARKYKANTTDRQLALILSLKDTTNKQLPPNLPPRCR
jgi:hypothetical protein